LKQPQVENLIIYETQIRLFMEHYLEQISIPPCVTNFTSLTQPYIRMLNT